MPHERAGTPARPDDLVDVPRLITAYYALHPDPAEPGQRVAFGTSGHRGSSLDTAFNEAHIARHQPGDLRVPRGAGHRRPALPRRRHPRAVRARPGHRARGARRQRRDRADRRARRLHADARRLARDPERTTAGAPAGLADGIVVTPSHNPPARRRLQVQPAATAARPTPTPPRWIAGPGQRADPGRPRGRPARSRYDRGARRRHHRPVRLPRPATSTTCRRDRPGRDPARRRPHRRRPAGRRVGRPTGGAIAERHGLDLTVVNPIVDPTWRVHDARLGRQDPDGLLVAVRDGVADRRARTSFDIATGNDADADRHGIVTPDGGLMNPNHYLAVAIAYLYAAPRRAGARHGDRQDAGVVAR